MMAQKAKVKAVYILPNLYLNCVDRKFTHNMALKYNITNTTTAGYYFSDL
jgi:hypothetical protein